MPDEIKDLDGGGLREFGLTTGGILAALFGLFFPWLLARPVPRWPWVIAAILVAWALAAPASLRPVYRGWMKLGLLLGRITTPLIMGAVFFLVVTPMGIARRLLGKDAIVRRFDEAASYRLPSHKAKAKDLENPF